jgi:hypothetical protein
VRRCGAALSIVGVMACLLAACGGVGVVANAGHGATHGRFASASASGQYAIAQAAGTAYYPGDLEVYVDASPAQQASITWGTTCLENSGGAGSKLQQKETVQVPAVVQVNYPKNAVQCILSANSQLSQGGTVRVELFNGGAPTIAPTGSTTNSASTSASQANTGTGVVSSTGAFRSCSTETVDLGVLGTWTLAGGGVDCVTAHSVFNQYENGRLRADGTTQPLGAWECRLTKLVAFKPGTNDGYEAWRCQKESDWVTFATGNPALANSPGATPSTATPAGFSTNGSGGSGTVPAGTYSGIAKVGAWGPTTDQVGQCRRARGFTIGGGSPAGTCRFARRVYRVVRQAYRATGSYPATVTTSGSPAYTATCNGGGNAGSITAPPIELFCGDPTDEFYVTISLPLGR